MAKYTELLSEYIEHGGELPAVFDTIEGFEDLFVGRYCDCEIGFETPILFKIKLEAKANLIIPAYAKRISEFEEAKAALLNPEKKRIKTGTIKREYGKRENTDSNTKTGEIVKSVKDTKTFTNEDHVSTEAELPFGGTNENEAITRRNVDKGFEDKTVTEATDTESYKDYEDKNTKVEQEHNDKETYENVTETESGYSATEAEALFKALENKVYIILNDCLEEFKNLFMKVY